MITSARSGLASVIAILLLSPTLVVGQGQDRARGNAGLSSIPPGPQHVPESRTEIKAIAVRFQNDTRFEIIQTLGQCPGSTPKLVLAPNQETLAVVCIPFNHLSGVIFEGPPEMGARISPTSEELHNKGLFLMESGIRTGVLRYSTTTNRSVALSTFATTPPPTNLAPNDQSPFPHAALPSHI